MKPYYVKGTIVSIFGNFITVESNSIGYLIEVIDSKNYEVSTQNVVYLYEFQFEDRYNLFGFKNENELKLFSQLLNVKGVGPKTALSLLRKIGSDRLKTYIVEGTYQSIAALGEIGSNTALEISQSLRARMKKEGALPRKKEVINVIKAANQLGFKNDIIEPIIEKYLNVELSEGELLKTLLNELRSKNI